MNRNRLLLIGVVALALAAFVSFSIYRVLRVAMGPQTNPNLVTVVAAASDLKVGARLEEKDVRLVKMPESELPPGFFRTPQEVLGRGVIVPITKSELILNSKLAASEAGAGLPSLIPQGMRAVSVKVNEVISVAGFVTPGTKVDVLLTGQPTKDASVETVSTTTVLMNVQVLAAGQKLQKNENGEPVAVTVVTLLVNPEDAQKLTLASSEGRIQLALRNPLDTATQELPVLRNVSLYRGVTTSTGAAKPRVERHFAKVDKQPAPPSVFTVEMIRGEHRDLAKF